MSAATPTAIHYLPIGTTVLSAIFCALLVRRYLTRRSGSHLIWWAVGVATYGLGTFLEASITLFGNSVILNKLWYVAGAILGGYPLAQGSVFLLLPRPTARLLTAISLPVIAVVSSLVLLSPSNLEMLEPHRPSGAVLAWSWVRWLTPFINLYAVLFLIGGALFSAWRYHRGREPGDGSRALGNGLIAFGAILPGIGGSMAKGGVVEALYLGEFVGIIFIWAGFQVCVAAPRKQRPPVESASRAPTSLST